MGKKGASVMSPHVDGFGQRYRPLDHPLQSRREILRGFLTSSIWETVKNPLIILLLLFNSFFILIAVMMTYFGITEMTWVQPDVPVKYVERIMTDSISMYFIVGYWIFILYGAYIGPKLLTQPMEDRSVTLYTCRPITKLDYLMVRMGTFCTFLAFLTFLPVIIIFGVGIGLADIPFSDKLSLMWILPAGLGVAVLVMITVAFVSMAVSSLTNKMAWAVGGVFMVFFMPTVVGGVLYGMTGNEHFLAMSLWFNVEVVMNHLFSIQIMTHDIHWSLSLGILLGVSAFCLWITAVKVTTTEVGT